MVYPADQECNANASRTNTTYSFYCYWCLCSARSCLESFTSSTTLICSTWSSLVQCTLLCSCICPLSSGEMSSVFPCFSSRDAVFSLNGKWKCTPRARGELTYIQFVWEKSPPLVPKWFVLMQMRTQILIMYPKRHCPDGLEWNHSDWSVKTGIYLHSWLDGESQNLIDWNRTPGTPL